MTAGRDLWWHEAIAGHGPTCEPEYVGAEHPLFLLYTSGSTGKPKGVQHCTAGYLLQAKLTTQWIFDLRDEDVFWCTADVGWVTGHSYVAYGPLAAGATVMLYEGSPTFPDGGRFWKNCQAHGVTVFYTAPTAIRALMKLGEGVPDLYVTPQDRDADFNDAATADVAASFAGWRAECELARKAAAAAPSLDVLAAEQARSGRVSLRWIMVHMIEEYARHNGHADLLRERIDGATGD